jgi:hypothetical protein
MFSSSKCKVKCTLVQALRLCTGCMAYRGSRGIALPFHDHSTRRGWGVSVMPRPLFTPRKNPVPIVQEAGWAPGPVWTGQKISHPSGFDHRTAQPIASRYTNYATWPTLTSSGMSFFFYLFLNITASFVHCYGPLVIAVTLRKSALCHALYLCNQLFS